MSKFGMTSAIIMGIVVGAIAGGCVIVVDGARGDSSWRESASSSGRPKLGVYTAEPGKALATQLSIDRKESTVITGIVEGSPAQRAGLREYDIITSIDGSTDADPSDLRRALRSKQWGEPIALVIVRDRQPIDMVVMLDEPDRERTPNY